MTMREYLLKVEGYNRVQYSENSRLRTLCYLVAVPHFKPGYENMSVYEFMPLPGDPSPEEIKRIEQENFDKEMAETRKMYDETMKAFRNGRV